MLSADVRQLEGWVRSEAEKYNILVEQRHHLEINAFAEQLRLKDEKLEAFRWRFLSMEMELKQLQSHIEGRNHDLSQVRQDNTKLDALLSDREAEINSLKQQFVLQLESLSCRKINLNSPSNDPDLGNETDWSKVKIIKRKPGGVEEETETDSTEISQKTDARKEEETFRISQSKDIILTIQSPGKEFEEEKDVLVDTVSIPEEVEIGEKSPLSGQSSSKSSITGWKLDLHALGVSYKVKRLKQQLLMLERLTGKRESFEDREGDDNDKRVGIKGLHTVISLFNKQATRYQSLQSKIDELCKRMVSRFFHFH